MKLLRILPVLLVFVSGFVAPANAADDVLPPHRVLSENRSEQRRQVSVRIERRLKEADLMRLSEAVRVLQTRPYARTIVDFFLPGQDLEQGAWATVAFTTEAKVTIQGLKQEDEEVLIAEFNADKRPLLGSWLTSPPAAPGRLTIFSDDGRIFGEWRLRNGQRTVDELVDVSTRSERRFEVQGGSTYVLTRSGDLEIRERSVLVAVAERIRPNYLALPTSVALGQGMSGTIGSTPARPLVFPKTAVGPAASPIRSEPKALAVPGPTIGPPVASRDPDGAPAVSGLKAKSKGQVLAKAKETHTRPARITTDTTPGDQIAAKLGRI